MHISTYIYGCKLLKEIGVFTIYDFRLRFLSFEPCSANFIIYARTAGFYYWRILNDFRESKEGV